jgi:hypothetical protein
MADFEKNIILTIMDKYISIHYSTKSTDFPGIVKGGTV